MKLVLLGFLRKTKFALENETFIRQIFLTELNCMKELFREQDTTLVSYYKAVLEDHEIPTMIRNEYLTASGLTEIPIPEFFPALCVLNDEDYTKAVVIIRERLITNQKNADTEITCVSCGETSPGNFETCWSCGDSLRGTWVS
ncbi:MAG: DUF2007 domain-containing protein [Akkermansiaceae bacterium]|nr:DUF2007 domain-containing protein [Akkermansiaceae bacterium]